MSRYPIDPFCQEPLLYDPFTGSPSLVSDLAGDVIILVNRASTDAQVTAHDAKFDFMQAVIGDIGKRVIKKAVTGSGRLQPIYQYNESHGLDCGYKSTWFGFLEDTIKEVQRQSFPFQRITVVFLTPDRLARSKNFHPHYPHSWGLSNTDYEQIDQWKRARFGRRYQYVRILTCFAGTPVQCRGLQSKIGMRYSGKTGGRPKGSRNKKSQAPKLTPQQKTVFGKLLRSELPYLVGELKLNGTQCYNYLKSHHGGYIPFARQTVCKWVATERRTPGTPGRPATSRITPVANPIPTEYEVPPPAEPITPDNKCNLLRHCYKRPSGQHPTLVRVKRIWISGKSLRGTRVQINYSFFPYTRIRLREIYDPP